MSDDHKPDLAPEGDLPEGSPAIAGEGENICPTCGGDGKKDGETCPECDGKGRVIEPIGGG